MTNTELMVENTALRMELVKVMEENKRLKAILAVGEIVKKNNLENHLAEIVVKEYHAGKKVKDSIEKVKLSLLDEKTLQAMVNEFLNPSEEQLAAEIIFRGRGIL